MEHHIIQKYFKSVLCCNSRFINLILAALNYGLAKSQADVGLGS